MKQFFPPDQDPDLRCALALGADEQRSLLASMLGEREAGTLSGSPTFTNIGVKTRRTSGGALSCRPIPFPKSAILAADSVELTICIDSYSISASRPRLPDGVRKLEEKIASLVPHRGIVRVPFSRPGTWTLHTIRSVIDLMLANLPPADRPPSDSPTVWLEPATDWKPYIYIGLSLGAWSLGTGFHAEVRLAPDLVNVLAAWPRSARNRDHHWRGPLEHLDAYMRTAAAQQVNPARLALPTTSVSDDDGDDADLDPIERVARRTLHGDRHSHQQARAATDEAEAEGDSLDRIADKLAQLPAAYAYAIEGIIDSLIEQENGR